MLDVDELISSAIEIAGGDDLGPPTWREGLEHLVASANEEGDLNPIGEHTMAVQITRSLANRVGVNRWRRAEPSISERPIEAPVFILGLPRSGTTLLSYLLDRDPANRSLLRGECFASTPPPEAATLRTDRRILAAQAEMDALYSVLPAFKAIHYERGDGPTECITVLGQELRSVHFETMANLPSYGRWHLSCDMAPAYEWHRDVLQVLQWHAPGRWVLKSPCHNLALDALHAVYPDARFVVPHRDPAVVVASLASLVSVLTGLGSDVDHDRAIGARWLDLAARMLDGLDDFRARHDDARFFDLAYTDLATDAMGAVAGIYGWLGWSLTDDAERAMRIHLGAAPAGRFGSHDYDLSRFGLSADEVHDRVPDYCRRHGFS